MKFYAVAIAQAVQMTVESDMETPTVGFWPFTGYDEEEP